MAREFVTERHEWRADVGGNGDGIRDNAGMLVVALATYETPHTGVASGSYARQVVCHSPPTNVCWEGI